MFNRTTSHESSQSRRKSIVEEFDDIDSINEIFKNKNNFLWTKTNRRNKYKSISIHENIIKIMKLYLIAWIIIDRKNTKNWTTWFEIRRMWLSDQMQEIWSDLVCRMRRRERVKNSDVLENLMLEKTRKIRHLLNEITKLNDNKCMMQLMIDESRSCKWFVISSSLIMNEMIVERLKNVERNASNY
jgi:hypothetical protein